MYFACQFFAFCVADYNGSVKALPRDIAEYLEYMSEIEDKDYSIEDTDEMER